MANQLPVSRATALKGIKWLRDNFEPHIAKAISSTPFSVEHICGIFCQETLYKVSLWLDKYDTATILSRCIMDASGDVPGTSRSAFPKNKEDFQSKYGVELTNMLIAEGNLQRAMPQPDAPGGYKPKDFLYKGYGLFQNDLQNIITNEAFFKEKQWYSFDHCIAGVMKELCGKYLITKDVAMSIQTYNGAGPKAVQYKENVIAFSEMA